MFYISADRETPPWISRIIQEDDIHIRHSTPPRRNGGEMAEQILLSLAALCGFRRKGIGGGTI